MKSTEYLDALVNQINRFTSLNSSEKDKYVAEAIFAIIAINGWNRIGVATNMVPEYQDESAHVVK